MIHFLNLIRWKNLLIIALSQILVKYALLEPLQSDYDISITLTFSGFIMLLSATLCIAAAGYIINDIEDVEADLINKPHKVVVGKYMSTKTATNWFIALNFIGVILGFLISYAVEKPNLFVIFVICSALLYSYATFLKHILLLGNIIMALMTAVCILLVGVFDLIPTMSMFNRDIQVFFLKLILDYAIFAFMLNFIRELVKDIEDVDGDYKISVKSLPIVLGRDRAGRIVFFLSLVPLVCLIMYSVNNLSKQPLALVYALLFLVGPLIYCSLKLYSASHKKHFKHVSSVLKLVMVLGVLSMLLFQLILTK